MSRGMRFGISEVNCAGNTVDIKVYAMVDIMVNASSFRDMVGDTVRTASYSFVGSAPGAKTGELQGYRVDVSLGIEKCIL